MSEITNIISQLERQKAAIDQAIDALREISSAAGVTGRGRPRKKRQLSPEGRARISAAAKKRWAAHKAAKRTQAASKKRAVKRAPRKAAESQAAS